MATDITGLGNRALTFLGNDRITDILTDATRAGVLLRDNYEQCRHVVLQAHPWNSALKRASVAASATAPAFEFTNSYPFPTDCLRVWEIYEIDSYKWVTEDRSILTDKGAPLQFKYISRITDPSRMEPLLFDAWASYLAYTIAYPLTNDKKIKSEAYSLYLDFLSQAKSMDGQEGSADKLRINDTESWSSIWPAGDQY